MPAAVQRRASWSTPGPANEAERLLAVLVSRFERLHFFERLSRTVGDRQERRLGDGDGQAGLRRKEIVEARQECAAADNRDSLFDQVGGELGGRPVEDLFDSGDDLVERLLESASDLAGRDRGSAEKSTHK